MSPISRLLGRSSDTSGRKSGSLARRPAMTPPGPRRPTLRESGPYTNPWPWPWLDSVSFLARET
eukprot:CAMPEP_0182433420 /NCGR_PEP_ID=MMETSP1167-20130531/63110_1 /TAXON_ID=2988 /ORGANISM="Mallomonas Sp, Strain CCMP3275" /LENGTH=63 /DNA_ID=CAMNT_0024622099 /DNA_START=82 /DNA_END=270 /DNA_ORIENTATION=-